MHKYAEEKKENKQTNVSFIYYFHEWPFLDKAITPIYHELC
jgi:hypothetical protein